MKITAIMTCFNRKEKTINCIETLINSNSNIEFQFIVVDDKSSDGTKETLLNNFDNVKVLDGTGHLYYSGGMRVGIQFAKDSNIECDYVFFLNDDVEFFNNAIEKLIDFSPNKECILVGATKDTQGEFTYGGVISSSKYRPSMKKVMSTDCVRYCDTFNANCVLIPFDIFMTLDNIDTVYIHSLGDYDYGLMATKAGFKIAVSDHFVGICSRNSAEGTWMDKKLPLIKRLEMKESPTGYPVKQWFYFTNKHFNFISAISNSLYQYIRMLY